MTFGKKLLELRIERGLKQEQISCDLNVSQSTYSDWEKGRIKPKRENLNKIAIYYKIDINELLEEFFKNKEGADKIINDQNPTINTSEELRKIAVSLENLTLLVEKIIQNK